MIITCLEICHQIHKNANIGTKMSFSPVWTEIFRCWPWRGISTFQNLL